jgi:diguanylate cyclase (GGDEF)-like protein/PAS domain S-box-containing protein
MTVNLLLITANPHDERAVGEALGAEGDAAFRVQRIARLPEDPGWLRDSGTTVVLLDLLLPDVRGIGALDSLLAAAPRIPILVFGSEGEAALGRQAVQRGALDFLPRSHLDSYSLPRALRNVIERKAAEEALFLEKERAQVTLDSIADAVLCIDAAGNVTYLNSVAASLLGWSSGEAAGRPLNDVFRLVDGTTRQSPARNPMELAMERNAPVGLAANSVLVRRDGSEIAIEDSAAPIRGRDGVVVGAVMVFHDVSASREVIARMSHLAQHDFLTDLPNPVMLNDRIAQAIALARRHDKQLAVLFMDLDRFKDVNDSLGHDTGDKLLKSVAQRLTACVRGSDSVSRKGGDEFVVLLSEITHAAHAASSAEKIIAAVTVPHSIDGRELAVTASIGIAVFPRDGVDAEGLLKSADAAMYAAKDAGRNQFRFSRQASIPAARVRRAATVAALP